MFSFKWRKGSSENICGFLGSLSRWRGEAVSSVNGGGLVSGSVSFQQIPSSSSRTQGFGGVGLGTGGMEQGMNLTWKTTRRATASMLFIGFPKRDKARKLSLGRGSSLLLKKAAEMGDAVESFHHEPPRHRVCRNRTSEPDCASKHPARPAARPRCPHPLAFPHPEVPERSRSEFRAASHFLGLQVFLWTWTVHPGPDQPSKTKTICP